ncbi:MAG: FAD-dependent oxidoreductase, partial [Longimicrobiaceae bacterium]
MKLELAFEGMTCLDCARRLEQALALIPGVRSAEVSYATQRGTVIAGGGVRPDDVLPVVEEAGYRAEIIRGAESGHSKQRPAAAASTQANGFDYDLVIIGSGGAGMAAAIRASELGRTAAVVEGAEVVGGTCVNIGCIPSKHLIEAAHHYHTASSAFPGIQPCEPRLAWADVLRQKREIVESLRLIKYLDVLAVYEGITLLRGHAKLLGDGRVRVGDQQVKARKIVLATGTRPAMPPIPGLDEAGALDSTSGMELETLPQSMIVIGGGSIGLE